jgi:hypothetical protein
MGGVWAGEPGGTHGGVSGSGGNSLACAALRGANAAKDVGRGL